MDNVRFYRSIALKASGSPASSPSQSRGARPGGDGPSTASVRRRERGLGIRLRARWNVLLFRIFFVDGLWSAVVLALEQSRGHVEIHPFDVLRSQAWQIWLKVVVVVVQHPLRNGIHRHVQHLADAEQPHRRHHELHGRHSKLQIAGDPLRVIHVLLKNLPARDARIAGGAVELRIYVAQLPRTAVRRPPNHHSVDRSKHVA
eukprot:scaffold1667_cov258-Pinguiococcus_pyrenoidosus.AAC.22